MIETIYIEEEIQNHPRVRKILARFPKARLILCERYGEIFNPKAQNFRLQKINPALILAKKYGNFILETPNGYGTGSRENYYFSHMLNCIYDCRYCFLQGMYRSAHYVLFVNYEDFETAIEKKIKETNEETYFFSGYDCDSLALDSVTGFTEEFLPFFEKNPNAFLELRTKSVQINSLLKCTPFENCVVAFSFMPSEINQTLEHKTPKVSNRIDAMGQIAQQGWKIGLRLDPLIYHEHFKTQYEQLIQDIFKHIQPEVLHSVSLGSFRLPKVWHENIYKLYPDEKLFLGPLQEKKGMISYPQKIEEEMTEFVTNILLKYVPKSIFSLCRAPNEAVVSNSRT